MLSTHTTLNSLTVALGTWALVLRGSLFRFRITAFVAVLPLVFTLLFAMVAVQVNRAADSSPSLILSMAVFPLGAALLVTCFGYPFTRQLSKEAGPGVRHKLLLTVVSFVACVGLASVGSATLTKAFVQAPTIGRVLIRIIGFPLVVEVFLLVIRLTARSALGHRIAAQYSLVFMLPTMLVASMLGRFLSTNLESFAETVGVSITIALVEMTMRFTLPWRDKTALALRRRLCCTSKEEDDPVTQAWRDRRWTHFHHAFMEVDSMCEDVGILASLPLTLLFAVPPSPGAQPLSTGAIVVRVVVQLLIELTTDVGAAVGVGCMRAVCSVRPLPVEAAELVTAYRPLPRLKRASVHQTDSGRVTVNLPVKHLARDQDQTIVRLDPGRPSPLPASAHDQVGRPPRAGAAAGAPQAPPSQRSQRRVSDSAFSVPLSLPSREVSAVQSAASSDVSHSVSATHSLDVPTLSITSRRGSDAGHHRSHRAQSSSLCDGPPCCTAGLWCCCVFVRRSCSFTYGCCKAAEDDAVVDAAAARVSRWHAAGIMTERASLWQHVPLRVFHEVASPKAAFDGVDLVGAATGTVFHDPEAGPTIDDSLPVPTLKLPSDVQTKYPNTQPIRPVPSRYTPSRPPLALSLAFKLEVMAVRRLYAFSLLPPGLLPFFIAASLVAVTIVVWQSMNVQLRCAFLLDGGGYKYDFCSDL